MIKKRGYIVAMKKDLIAQVHGILVMTLLEMF